MDKNQALELAVTALVKDCNMTLTHTRSYPIDSILFVLERNRQAATILGKEKFFMQEFETYIGQSFFLFFTAN